MPHWNSFLRKPKSSRKANLPDEPGQVRACLPHLPSFTPDLFYLRLHPLLISRFIPAQYSSRLILASELLYGYCTEIHIAAKLTLGACGEGVQLQDRRRHGCRGAPSRVERTGRYSQCVLKLHSLPAGAHTPIESIPSLIEGERWTPPD